MVFFSHYEKYENRMLHVTFLKCGFFFTTKFPPNYSTRCVHVHCTSRCVAITRKNEIYSVYTKLINVCNELINELMKKINDEVHIVWETWYLFIYLTLYNQQANIFIFIESD